VTLRDARVARLDGIPGLTGSPSRVDEATRLVTLARDAVG